MDKKIKSFTLSENKDDVSLTTNVTLDFNGVVEGKNSIKNKNFFKKRRVEFRVEVKQNVRTVFILIKQKTLSSVLAGIFVPGKSSSHSEKIHGSINYDIVDLENATELNRILHTIDEKIKKLASDIRKMKILSGKESEEVLKLTEELKAAKKERIKIDEEQSLELKYESLRLEVKHEVYK